MNVEIFSSIFRVQDTIFLRGCKALFLLFNKLISSRLVVILSLADIKKLYSEIFMLKNQHIDPCLTDAIEKNFLFEEAKKILRSFIYSITMFRNYCGQLQFSSIKFYEK